jgi:hypothetical protein
VAHRIEIPRTWQLLIQLLPDYKEEELKAMINRELRGLNRKYFLLRLHGRYNKLRLYRERKQLKAGKALDDA